MAVENLHDLLLPVNELAHIAGEKILQIYNTEFTVDRKGDNSPLTEADLVAHQCIVEGLSVLSDYPIISEESTAIPFAERVTWQTYWLVDPLDGTKEFIKRNGDFTVNIALIHCHRPVLGVVYVPVKKQCYYALQGAGAFKQTSEQTVHAIRVRSKKPDPPVVVGSRSHRTPELEKYLNQLPAHTLLSVGSSLKFCLIAEGVADLYPRMGLTSEWDTAAAQCVVEQAGGTVIDIDGKRLEYNSKASFLNPYFLVYGDKRCDWSKYAKLIE